MEHQVFDLGYVTIEAVEAGYNRWHDVSECVGYVLTFSNGRSIYVTGDTSTMEQMPDMAEMEIDYAFSAVTAYSTWAWRTRRKPPSWWGPSTAFLTM